MQRNSIGIGIALGIVLLVAGAGAVTALGGDTAPAATQTDPANTTAADTVERTIHVTATGDAEADPDQAVVHVTVRAEADDVGTVRDDLATGSADLTAALDELGVEYETTSYSISEQYQSREGERVPTYQGTHRYKITADDPDLAGAVADAAAEAGAEIDRVSLTLSDERRAELREEAIRNAMGDARQQADVIADEGGLTVTAPKTVDASQRSYAPVPYERAQADQGGAPPTDIAAGTVTVSYNVDVTYTAVRE
jgi:uncharacterized protein YggE